MVSIRPKKSQKRLSTPSNKKEPALNKTLRSFLNSHKFEATIFPDVMFREEKLIDLGAILAAPLVIIGSTIKIIRRSITVSVVAGIDGPNSWSGICPGEGQQVNLLRWFNRKRIVGRDHSLKGKSVNPGSADE